MTSKDNLIHELSQEFKNVDSTVIAALVYDNSDEEYLRSVLEMLTNEGESAPYDESFDLENIPDSPPTISAEDERIIEKFGQKVLDLHNCFPRRPAWVLHRKLEEFNNDMEKTIDWLLNEEYLHELAYEDNEQENVDYRPRNSKKIRVHESNIALLARMLNCSTEKATVLYNENDQNVQKTLMTQKILGFEWLDHKSSSSKTINPDINSSSITYRPSNANSDKTKVDYLYNKAREYYEKSKSNPLLSGAAHYYATEAHAERDWHYKDLIKRQTTIDSVDFHNIPTNYAVESCKKLLSDKRMEGRREFTIITGTGRHSVNNVPKTKNAIRNLLNDSNYKYYENQASFNVVL